MAIYAHSVASDGRGGTIMLPPFVPPTNLTLLARDFKLRDDDVLVVSYPKAGTTWMEQVVHLLVNEGAQGEIVLGTAVPWVETLPQREGGLSGFLATMSGRRLFNSHLPVQLMPGIDSGHGRFVYVARNPKDIAVSFFHHDRSKNDYDGSWDDYFERFINGQVHFGLVFDHVLGWWAAAQERDDVLFVTYEAMKAHLLAIAALVATFIGVDADPQLLDTVVARSGFDAMAQNPKTDLSWVPQREGIPKHYRRGVVGDWRNHFSVAQSERFDALYLTAMEGSGLRFDFGDGVVLP